MYNNTPRGSQSRCSLLFTYVNRCLSQAYVYATRYLEVSVLFWHILLKRKKGKYPSSVCFHFFVIFCQFFWCWSFHRALFLCLLRSSWRFCILSWTKEVISRSILHSIYNRSLCVYTMNFRARDDFGETFVSSFDIIEFILEDCSLNST